MRYAAQWYVSLEPLLKGGLTMLLQEIYRFSDILDIQKYEIIKIWSQMNYMVLNGALVAVAIRVPLISSLSRTLVPTQECPTPKQREGLVRLYQHPAV